MQFLSFFLTLGFVFNLALATLAIPPRPSDDDFYNMPANISAYKAGEIMKWRNTPQQVRSLLYPINIKGAWQFMVRSVNTQGQPIGIVGTILQPYNADPSKVLVYNYAEDSASKNCAPSYSILFGASDDTIGLQMESIYMNSAFSKGWNVLVPDYEGPNSAFTAGRLEGMATLNAIRATLSSGKTTGINSNAKVGIWGYSGGTIPLAWAATLQPSYAPELSKNLIGVAVGGWVTNITQVVESIDGGPFAGFVGVGLLGLATEYPDVQNEIFPLMDPLRINQVKTLYNKCVTDAVASFLGASFFKGKSPIFTSGMDVLQRPEIKKMTNENILVPDSSSPVPQVPFFVYHGQLDEIIPFDNSQKVYDSWCSRGMASMEFAVSQTTGHLSEFFEGGPAALQWLSKRFNGESPVSGCSRTVRRSNLQYPGANLSISAIARTTILAVFQNQLGPLLQISNSSPQVKDAINRILAGLMGTIRLMS